MKNQKFLVGALAALALTVTAVSVGVANIGSDLQAQVVENDATVQSADVVDPYCTNETVYVPYTGDGHSRARLTSMGDYIEDGQYGKRWRIRNESSEVTVVDWSIYKTEYSGQFEIPADTEVHFTSHFVDGADIGATMNISYDDGTKINRATKSSSNSPKDLAECKDDGGEEPGLVCEDCSSLFAGKEEFATLVMTVEDMITGLNDLENNSLTTNFIKVGTITADALNVVNDLQVAGNIETANDVNAQNVNVDAKVSTDNLDANVVNVADALYIGGEEVFPGQGGGDVDLTDIDNNSVTTNSLVTTSIDSPSDVVDLNYINLHNVNSIEALGLKAYEGITTNSIVGTENDAGEKVLTFANTLLRDVNGIISQGDIVSNGFVSGKKFNIQEGADIFGDTYMSGDLLVAGNSWNDEYSKTCSVGELCKCDSGEYQTGSKLNNSSITIYCAGL
ncbi:hypothetical protein GF340_00510 [Candidatus Peregrinibacteria bacterium]|nr:hypothetical protein [Candidatus Peregrinibacteria bacterium]